MAPGLLSYGHTGCAGWEPRASRPGSQVQESEHSLDTREGWNFRTLSSASKSMSFHPLHKFSGEGEDSLSFPQPGLPLFLVYTPTLASCLVNFIPCLLSL